MDIQQIPIHLIDEDKDQPRFQFAEDSLLELMKSIEEIGLLSPIKVRKMSDNRYKIIYGNRRYKACKTLGFTAIPCIVSLLTSELDIYLEQIAENLTREGFSPIEEAEAFHKLLNDVKFRSSVKFLSSKLGKPESYIKNKCELLNFSRAVQKLIVGGTEIRKNKLTEDQLIPIKDLPTEQRNPLAIIIARDEMPVSDVKKIARMFKSKEIPDKTKEKLLLFKTGPGLLESWSTMEHNKTERAKPAESKTSTTNKKPVNLDQKLAKNPIIERNSTPIEPASSPAEEVRLHAEPEAVREPSMKLGVILHQLLNAIPSDTAILTDLDQRIDSLDYNRTEIHNEIDTLIERLERHLLVWQKVRSAIE